MSNLTDSILSLSEIERRHLRAIIIRPGSGGYQASFEFRMRLPVNGDSGVEGVELRGFTAYPSIEQLLDWRTPIWDQIQTAINDERIVGECGQANAAEWGDGQTEKTAHWLIKFDRRP